MVNSFPLVVTLPIFNIFPDLLCHFLDKINPILIALKELIVIVDLPIIFFDPNDALRLSVHRQLLLIILAWL